MLNPNNDRLDYGQILAPPANYLLDFAVGTTYSLNLDALVGASLAMGLSEETDSELMKNPFCLLEALRSTGDKVALFCESGQIHLPNKVNSLYILLEKMVFSIVTKKKKGIAAYPSFHPKFWLIRYVNHKKEYLYRVAVMSRNLTFDRSWDVSFYMDGTATKSPTSKNDPVCDFLRFLQKSLPSDENGKLKAKKIRSLINDLPYVKFETNEKQFDDFEFLPTGFKNDEGKKYQIMETSLFQDTFHEVFVMSPFLSSGIIRDFNDRNDRTGLRGEGYMLITREQSLGKLKPEDVTNFRIFTMRDVVIDGESSISEDAQNIQKQDIHAKAYMLRKNSTSNLYLGSLNASHNAAHGNVEFMIRLQSKRRYLDLDRLTASLFGEGLDGDDCPFQEVTLENAIIDDEDEQGNALNAVIKDIARSKPHAEVTEDGEHYTLQVFFGNCDTKGFSVEVRPLLSNKIASFDNTIEFKKLTITQLSEFYNVLVTNGERSVRRVLKIQTDGLPDGREKAIVSSVVNDKECFYRYIAFLLGDNIVLGMLEGEDSESELNEGNEEFGIKPPTYKPSLYEKMLKTAALAPEKFRGIDYLIKMISEDGVVPEDFKQLYETFRKVVKIND